MARVLGSGLGFEEVSPFSLSSDSESVTVNCKSPSSASSDHKAADRTEGAQPMILAVLSAPLYNSVCNENQANKCVETANRCAHVRCSTACTLCPSQHARLTAKRNTLSIDARQSRSADGLLHTRVSD